jgi:hypothetical protein
MYFALIKILFIVTNQVYSDSPVQFNLRYSCVGSGERKESTNCVEDFFGKRQMRAFSKGSRTV